MQRSFWQQTFLICLLHPHSHDRRVILIDILYHRHGHVVNRVARLNISRPVHLPGTRSIQSTSPLIVALYCLQRSSHLLALFIHPFQQLASLLCHRPNRITPVVHDVPVPVLFTLNTNTLSEPVELLHGFTKSEAPSAPLCSLGRIIGYNVLQDATRWW